MNQAKPVERIHRFTLNLKKEHYEWIRKAAHRERVSISQWINMAIEERRESAKRA
jgi:hypothetical protein